MSSTLAPARDRVVSRVPALGVRLGSFSDTEISLAIGDYSGRDAPHCVCAVPVVERGRGYQLYRRDTANGPPYPEPSYPEPGDIGRSVFVQYSDRPPTPDVAERGARQAKGARYVVNVDTFSLRHAFERVVVPRRYWDGDENGAPDGVLVLTMYLLVVPDAPPPADPQDDPFVADIAHAITATLKDNERDPLTELNDLDLLIVPTTAVPRRDERKKEFSFALASCQYTLGMVDGTPKGLSTGPGDASYQRLRQAIDAGLRFAILAGDQVYVDATAGLFDPTASRGRFRKPYEQYFGSRVVQDVQRMLPLYMVMDDHEIENNWEDAKDHVWGPLMEKWGRPAYIEYERGIGTLPDPNPLDKLWSSKAIDDHEFFFADTRTRRETRTAATLRQRSLLGTDQARDLDRWLCSNASTGPRFLVSSSIVLPRRLATNGRPSAALQSDAWDGFPSSLEALLSTIACEGRSNIVCLSGDEHLSCFATATLRSGKSTVTLCSIHCSGLYAPYPFSNSTPEDLAERERFRFKDRTGMTWSCDVSAKFFSGQGFCIISVVPKARSRWTVRAEFNLDSGTYVEHFP